MEDRGGYIWVPYKEWLGANIPNPRWSIATPFPWFVNHYTPGQEATSYADAVRLLRNIWNFHTYSAEGDGWGWIGYNTLQYGRYIFEGAGIGNRGIHAPGANGISHGHAHLVSERNVTDQEWMALRAFVTDLVSWNVIQPQVLTNPAYFTHHCDWISTTCSGPVQNTASHFYNVPSPVPTPPVVEENPFVSRFDIRVDRSNFPARLGKYTTQDGKWSIADAGALDAFAEAGDTVNVWLNGQSGNPLDICLLEASGKETPGTVRWALDGHMTFKVTARGKVSIVTWLEGVDYITAEVRKV